MIHDKIHCGPKKKVNTSLEAISNSMVFKQEIFILIKSTVCGMLLLTYFSLQ